MSQTLDRPSQWIKCISTGGTIRGVVIDAADLINEMAQAHALEPRYLQGLGEAVMGALLIASSCKAGERINLNIRGSGEISQALIDAYPDGTTRGYVVGSKLSGDHVIHLSFAAGASEAPATVIVGPGYWGEGLLSVLRTKHQEGEQPYIGTVPLLTGHLAKDLTFYWLQSEQIASAVGLAVNIEDGRVTSAGGFLVQAMPGASPAEVASIEQHIQEIQSLSRSVASLTEPLRLLSGIFQDTAFVVLEERPLAFKCDCSWDRVQRALTLVGVDELRSMLKEDHGAEVRCDFCAKSYAVSAERLQELIAAATAPRGE